MEPVETTVTVETEPAAESSQDPSIERTIGQLETETEHLSEEVQEATETAEAAEETAEIAIEIASGASNRTFDAEIAISELREQVRDLAAMFESLSEAEDDQESSTAEEVDLPAETEAEPVPEVKARWLPDWVI